MAEDEHSQVPGMAKLTGLFKERHKESRSSFGLAPMPWRIDRNILHNSRSRA
jgi:hypothetical protein